MGQPQILISNDDGFQSDGIKALTESLTSLGDVWVVAPDRERSATSHAISLHKPLRVRQLGERRFCVDGTPTDCVYLALHHIMNCAPDIVVSGINHGSNLGNDVLYSGTVSAAMEGALFGYPAVAVSLALSDSLDGERPPPHFEAAAAVTAEITRAVLERPMPPGVLLNVNVPNRPREALEGIKLCRLGYSSWNDRVDMRHDPRNKPYYWIGGERDSYDSVPDSDNNAVVAGYVAVTPVHYDLTDYRSFSYVRALDVTGVERVKDELGSEPLVHTGEGMERRRSRRRP